VVSAVSSLTSETTQHISDITALCDADCRDDKDDEQNSIDNSRDELPTVSTSCQ